MNKSKVLSISGLLVLLALAGWNWRETAALPAERPIKVHIFYSSDALGYTEPCG